MNTDNKTAFNPLEPMPTALLAEMFSKGIVVIPEEFKRPEIEENKGVVETGSIKQTEPQPKEAGKENTGKTQINYLGNFGRNVLVVVNDPTSLHLNEEDLDLLGKILASVKLSMSDIALVNAATQNLNYYVLQDQLPASVAFYFGIEPVSIGAPIKFPEFQVQKWNHTTFLFVPELEKMGPLSKDAKSLKTELWTAMKKIFE